jgi:hypothetical protein
MHFISLRHVKHPRLHIACRLGSFAKRKFKKLIQYDYDDEYYYLYYEL